MNLDLTPWVVLLILASVFTEVGAILVFRTITGIGPRPTKLIAFGLAGIGLALALFFAHVNFGVLWVGVSLLVAFVAQAWLLWLMCRRHWDEWQRRERARRPR